MRVVIPHTQPSFEALSEVRNHYVHVVHKLLHPQSAPAIERVCGKYHEHSHGIARRKRTDDDQMIERSPSQLVVVSCPSTHCGDLTLSDRRKILLDLTVTRPWGLFFLKFSLPQQTSSSSSRDSSTCGASVASCQSLITVVYTELIFGLTRLPGLDFEIESSE